MRRMGSAGGTDRHVPPMSAQGARPYLPHTGSDDEGDAPMNTSPHIHTAIARDVEARRIAAAGTQRLARHARRAAVAEASVHVPRPALRWLPSLRSRVTGTPRHAS
jgi:hypothetical protein